MTSDQILLVVAVIALLLFSISMLVGVIQFLLRRYHRIPRPSQSIKNENERILPPRPIVTPVVGEEDVSASLQSYRHNIEVQSWEKLNSLDSVILAKYLRKEYPQVAAIVLSKLSPKKSAEVLSQFSGTFSAEVIIKMLNMHSVDAGLAGTIGRAIADGIEKNVMDNASNHVSSIFRCLDAATEEKIMAVLENTSPSIIASLQDNAVQFSDLLRLSTDDLRKAVAHISEPKLVMALRGASEKMRNHFYSAMPDEQANVICQALAQLGPIKINDIENAQQDIVNVCRKMFADDLRGR